MLRCCVIFSPASAARPVLVKPEPVIFVKPANAAAGSHTATEMASMASKAHCGGSFNSAQEWAVQPPRTITVAEADTYPGPDEVMTELHTTPIPPQKALQLLVYTIACTLLHGVNT